MVPDGQLPSGTGVGAWVTGMIDDTAFLQTKVSLSPQFKSFHVPSDILITRLRNVHQQWDFHPQVPNHLHDNI